MAPTFLFLIILSLTAVRPVSLNLQPKQRKNLPNNIVDIILKYAILSSRVQPTKKQVSCDKSSKYLFCSSRFRFVVNNFRLLQLVSDISVFSSCFQNFLKKTPLK